MLVLKNGGQFSLNGLISQMFIKHPVYARHSYRHWGYDNVHDLMESPV